jgi:hypothetical protein
MRAELSTPMEFFMYKWSFAKAPRCSGVLARLASTPYRPCRMDAVSTAIYCKKKSILKPTEGWPKIEEQFPPWRKSYVHGQLYLLLLSAHQKVSNLGMTKHPPAIPSPLELPSQLTRKQWPGIIQVVLSLIRRSGFCKGAQHPDQ